MKLVKKQLVALSLILVVLTILSSTCLVKGYINEYNEIEQVKEVTSPTTFTTQNGYIVKLANIEATKNEETTNPKNIFDYLKTGNTTYLNVSNQTMENNSVILTSVVYVQYNSTYFQNVNKALLNGSNYFFSATNNQIFPYDWQVFVENISLANNNLRLDYSTFDSQRIALMNIYSNQTVTHAGFLITTIIAAVTLFVTFLTQGKAKLFVKKHKIVCFASLTIIISLAFFITYRLFFWSWMTSAVLGVTPVHAINQNTPSVISGIQSYLTYTFKHPSPSTYSSLLYYLDQDWPYMFLAPWSIVLSLPLSMLASSILMGIFDSKKNNYGKNYLSWTGKWFIQGYTRLLFAFKEYRKQIFFGIVAGIVAVVTLTTPYLLFVHPLDIFNSSQLEKVGSIVLADLVVIFILVSYFFSRYLTHRNMNSIFCDQ